MIVAFIFAYLIISSWSIYLSVKLDKYRLENEELRKKVRYLQPPF